MPALIARTPKELNDHRAVDICRYKHVIRSVKVVIAGNFYDGHAPRVPSDRYGSDILIAVSSQDGLDHNKIIASPGDILHTEIINIAVAVEVQIGNSQFRIV
jgi:hypothetical protein